MSKTIYTAGWFITQSNIFQRVYNSSRCANDNPFSSLSWQLICEYPLKVKSKKNVKQQQTLASIQLSEKKKASFLFN
jgi:hypothetical protein